MRFHLLFLVLFVALGSCRGFNGSSRALSASSCEWPGCPCNCPQNACPPCPTPQPAECLNGCGSSRCPCSTPRQNQKTTYFEAATGAPSGKKKALALSTVNVYPTGPICSGFSILPNLVVTTNTCVLGKKISDLYVTLNGPLLPFKVTKILVPTFEDQDIFPAILVHEKPTQPTNYFALPALPVDKNFPGEIHKWEVLNDGWDYKPLRTEVPSHQNCHVNDHLRYVCVNTTDSITMGWNDIGTVFVEIRNNFLVVQGIYVGDDLYKTSNSIKYLSLYEYRQWMYNIIDKYA